MCSVPMIIDSDKRCAPTSIRFGNRCYYGGFGVNPHDGNMSRRSNINKWRARMLLHRKIRKAIEKKREILMNEHEQSVIGSRMKRRKSFRHEKCSIDDIINFYHINSLKSFQARMYLLQKVRFLRGDFPEELVGQCILSDRRKREVFQESVRMSCATAAAVSSNKAYGSPTTTAINPTYNDKGFVYVSPTVIHPTFIY